MPIVSAHMSFEDLLLRTDVDLFSLDVLGVSYASVKRTLYPNPRYRTFVIQKKNGSQRIIHEPTRQLKNLQLRALEFLKSRAGQIKPCVHGFVENRSIVTNARRHLATKPHHVLNIDLEDFFPSITFYRVRGVFQKAPFNLSHQVATVMAQLCTMGNSLPQGAPTSPLLSNLVCSGLDSDLMALARRNRATYTRYADDITFSFSVRNSSRLPENICTYDSGLVTLGHELTATIESEHNFRINASKTRLSCRQHRLEVTGVTINEFPNVKRNFIDRIRGGLHAWETYGYERAQAEWAQRVQAGWSKPYKERPWKRRTRVGATPELKNVLWGKLLYVRMVRGKDDSIYTRLAERYNRLRAQEIDADSNFRCSSLPVESIVRNAADAEAATFVLEWSADYSAPGKATSEAVCGQGTTFAYAEAGQLITCDHVLTWTGEIDGTPLVVDCEDSGIKNLTLEAHNPTTGATWPLTIVRRDPGRDLAVLKITTESLPHRHFVGLESPIHRNEKGILIGYPNWSKGRRANHVNTEVLSRYPRSALNRFEISTLIRQGNSGGPFVGMQYSLAGIAQQGATQSSGNNECLCVTELDAWLAASSPAESAEKAQGAKPAAGVIDS